MHHFYQRSSCYGIKQQYLSKYANPVIGNPDFRKQKLMAVPMKPHIGPLLTTQGTCHFCNKHLFSRFTETQCKQRQILGRHQSLTEIRYLYTVKIGPRTPSPSIFAAEFPSDPKDKISYI